MAFKASSEAATSFALLGESEIEEIAARAWQNVAAFSGEYTPRSLLAGLADIEALPQNQLEYRSCLQFLLSNETAAFMNAAPALLRRLSQTTVHERQQGRAPIGLVDWPSTIVQRLARGGTDSIYLLRGSETRQDVPENRLLRFVLNAIVTSAASVLPSQIEGWPLRVRELEAAAQLSPVVWCNS